MTAMPGTREHGGKWRRANALLGVLLLAALVLVVENIGEERRFAALLTQAAPGWLLVAVAYQAGTYVCAAGVWYCVLRCMGVSLRLRSLVPLGLAKLFVDQVVPTAGVGGTLLVVHGLIRRGIPQGLAMAALLMDLLSFYAMHILAVVLALLIIWTYHDLQPVILVLTTLFSAVAVLVPFAILWLNRRGDHMAPGWMRRLPGVARFLKSLAKASADAFRNPTLWLQTSVCQGAIFVLDAATLDAMLRAVGHPAPPAVVFASFTMAMVVATLGFTPGSLGIFEGGAVAMLQLFNIPVEAGLAATLLLRAFTFWLPMLPGLWIARHEHIGQDTR